MRKAAFGFLLRRKCVLLAQKTDGKYPGLWTGYGGKLDGKESITAALVREIKEESSLIVDPKDLFPSAVVTTYLGNLPQYEFHIFTAWRWGGRPRNSAEMRNPTWFPFDRLPVDEMFPGDRQWLGRVLNGERFSANVHVDKDGELKRRVAYRNTPRYHPYDGPAE